MDKNVSSIDEVLDYLEKITTKSQYFEKIDKSSKDALQKLVLHNTLKEVIHCPLYFKDEKLVSVNLPPEPTKKSWLFGILSWNEPNYDAKKSLIETLFDTLEVTYQNETIGYGHMLRKAHEVNAGHARAYAAMLKEDSKNVQSYKTLINLLDGEKNLEDELTQERVLKRDWLSIKYRYR
ncbi:hypothetical protein COT72_02720 [archaeon CG10_big_fil_rev_8_21_14_0_10_43_11]|nr:MAG: hypothetical protein COT72_02720 [archaeon CG10_big_fil_rev_8_21_14_0_10_43_11]